RRRVPRVRRGSAANRRSFWRQTKTPARRGWRGGARRRLLLRRTSKRNRAKPARRDRQQPTAMVRTLTTQTSSDEEKSEGDGDDAGKVAVEVDGESPPSPLQVGAEQIAADGGGGKNSDAQWRPAAAAAAALADEAQRLDAFVAECHRAIEQEADSLRAVQAQPRALRAQQQSLEQADARSTSSGLVLHASASRRNSARQPPHLRRCSYRLRAGFNTARARQGALAWDAGEADSDPDGDAESRLARLRNSPAPAAADLLQAPPEPAASRLRPAASTPATASRRSLRVVGGGKRRRQPTNLTPTRELPGVHVWDVAIVRHTGSLCYRADGGSSSEADGSDVRYCPAGGGSGGAAQPEPLLPAASLVRLLAVSPDGATLGELRLSPRRPRGNLERLRCLGDRLYTSEPEFVYVTDLSGLCLHVLSGFSWAMGLWPDPDRRRLLVVNGDRALRSLCDDEFTDDLTGVCVLGNRILVADHTAYQLHIYRADNLQFVGRLQVSSPRFLVVDSAGVVYITATRPSITRGDKENFYWLAAKVTVLDPANGRQFSCGYEGSRFGEFRSPSGLAVDEVAGEIYVSDFDNERVQHRLSHDVVQAPPSSLAAVASGIRVSSSCRVSVLWLMPGYGIWKARADEADIELIPQRLHSTTSDLMVKAAPEKAASSAGPLDGKLGPLLRHVLAAFVVVADGRDRPKSATTLTQLALADQDVCGAARSRVDEHSRLSRYCIALGHLRSSKCPTSVRLELSKQADSAESRRSSTLADDVKKPPKNRSPRCTTAKSCTSFGMAQPLHNAGLLQRTRRGDMPRPFSIFHGPPRCGFVEQAAPGNLNRTARRAQLLDKLDLLARDLPHVAFGPVATVSATPGSLPADQA
uniref:RING-type domain-containing protein n=1 Tax=Macrostomum lignano TaxID=282301 RepID=A0A1I8IX32_9PLAT